MYALTGGSHMLGCHIREITMGPDLNGFVKIEDKISGIMV